MRAIQEPQRSYSLRFFHARLPAVKNWARHYMYSQLSSGALVWSDVMKKIISSLVAVMGMALLTGCSGSTPGFMTPTKPRSASDDPAMDPFERVGTQLKEKQSSAPAAAPVAAPAPVSQPAAAPAPVAPAPKTAQ
jgi:hypothetical protein